MPSVIVKSSPVVVPFVVIPLLAVVLFVIPFAMSPIFSIMPFFVLAMIPVPSFDVSVLMLAAVPLAMALFSAIMAESIGGKGCSGKGHGKNHRE